MTSMATKLFFSEYSIKHANIILLNDQDFSLSVNVKIFLWGKCSHFHNIAFFPKISSTQNKTHMTLVYEGNGTSIVKITPM